MSRNSKNEDRVLGLMSGSSLDGVDIAVVEFREDSGKPFPGFKWITTDFHAYPDELISALRELKSDGSISDYFSLETKVSKFYGELILEASQKIKAGGRPFLAGVHGHTFLHEPSKGYSVQINSASQIAHFAKIPVCVDFRSADIAAGGQGAPMAPIVDQLFANKYDLFLNLGGIANLSHLSAKRKLGFDVCACNQLLNFAAGLMGLSFDSGGKKAEGGKIIGSLLESLNRVSFLFEPPPKSLSNQEVEELFLTKIKGKKYAPEDLLRTLSEHIAQSVKNALLQNDLTQTHLEKAKMLVTGGGGHNDFLVQLIEKHCHPLGVEVILGEERLIDFKECLLMAYMAWLRWRGKENFISETSGASGPVISSGLYLPPN